MPIKRAAYKRVRADKKRKLRNLSAISAIKSMARKLNNLISSKNKSALEQALKNFYSLVDKAANKGIIHKSTASRNKARMAKKVLQVSKKS